MGIKVEWEIRIYWKDLGKTRGNKITPGVVYGMHGFLLKQREEREYEMLAVMVSYIEGMQPTDILSLKLELDET